MVAYPARLKTAPMVLAEHVVALIDPVAVFRVVFHIILGPALADEFRCRGDGRVRRAHGEIEEERLVGLALANPLDRLGDSLCRSFFNSDDDEACIVDPGVVDGAF
jgi:hypothetical protein